MREGVKMRRCEDEKMKYRPPLLEEPCAQTLSGKNSLGIFDPAFGGYVIVKPILGRLGSLWDETIWILGAYLKAMLGHVQPMFCACRTKNQPPKFPGAFFCAFSRF